LRSKRETKARDPASLYNPSWAKAVRPGSGVADKTVDGMGLAASGFCRAAVEISRGSYLHRKKLRSVFEL
jgi:hypothetical protein